MIDALSFLILILLSIGLSHLVRPYDRRMRLFWCSAPGALLLFLVHPFALLFALCGFSVSVIVFLVGRFRASDYVATRLPYFILLLLFVPDLFGSVQSSSILWLGSAFFIVRQMMTVSQGIKTSSKFGDLLAALTLSTFFFAALPSGPIFNGLKCWKQLKENRPPEHTVGFYRLFEGFVYLFAVAGFINLFVNSFGQQYEDIYQSGQIIQSLILFTLLIPVASFCLLFAAFYGYSRMAEGSALLLGFEVPQNFNKPHLARDLGDFWQRWHRSMADFVMQYIYLPLLVSGLGTRVSILLAFIFMGLWHNLSLSFLIWGIGHGLGLAIFLPWARKRSVSPIVMRSFSIFYIISLSSIAHGIATR